MHCMGWRQVQLRSHTRHDDDDDDDEDDDNMALQGKVFGGELVATHTLKRTHTDTG